MKKHLRHVVPLAFSLFTILYLYIFLHEAGHAIVCLASGGSVTEFTAWPLPPEGNVGISGNFTSGQNLFLHSAGVLLPLFVWLGMLFSASIKAGSPYRFPIILSSALVLNTLLPWILLLSLIHI